MAFTIENKSAQKVLLITASGFFKMDEALQFIRELKSTIAGIGNTSSYHLVINARDQKTVAQDVQNVLAQAIDIYMNTPFKSRQSVVFDSVISKSQILRLGNQDVATKFEFHDTLDAALAKCR